MTDESLVFEEKLELRSWGLPDHILQKYTDRGITKMFPWQVECLMSENVLLGGNLIYSAPTSAGKTLVSEMLALKTVLERRKKVIVILPFVSVVREKMLYFQDILSGSGVKVDGFMGSYNPPGGFKNIHLAICTIEKANNIINRMLEEKNFEDIGCIVVDELHMLGDPNRGYLLELLLTKLKYVCQKGMAQGIQIVGMSATLPNLDLLARWLNATLYHTEFRPIPLYEYLKVGRTIYKSPDLIESFDFKTICEIPNDAEDVISLCLDTIIQGFSVLVFCPAKNWCETLAVQISAEIKRLGNEKNNFAQQLRKQLNSRGIFDTLEQLKKSPAGLERNLAKSVAFGVAYHHAGLTLDERDIIEGGFRQNVVRVLVATSTLSSGVNLPARRVIIRTPAFQGQCMDILTYKQMIGRAGRMGKDTAGESYLICNPKDLNWGKQLIVSQLPPVESCLGLGDLSSCLKRAILEVVAGGVVTSSKEVEEYTQCTLLAASANDERLSSAIQTCTNYLAKNEFIRVDSDGGVLPSSLAEACLSSSVAPDQALYLLKELHKARQCFVLDSDLHAIYQVTPYSICDSWNVDWMKVFAIWENLPPNLQKIGDLVGVEDRFLIRAMRGTINLNSDEYAHKISIHKRFYTCLALQDLINEAPLTEVASKYGCTKGMLQSLQQSASTFAAMVTSFCKKLGWSGLEVLISDLATRIQFGVQKELLDLMRLECMTSFLARALFNTQITTLSELASSSIQTVHLAINKAKPFKSETIESTSSEKKDVYLQGRPGLSEKQAAEILIFEARRFLLKEMGVKTAEWDERRQENDSIYNSTTVVSEENPNSSNKMETSCNPLPVSLQENIVSKNEACNRTENIIGNGKLEALGLNLDNLDENDPALADTEIFNPGEDINISPVKRADNCTSIPETQGAHSQSSIVSPHAIDPLKKPSQTNSEGFESSCRFFDGLEKDCSPKTDREPGSKDSDLHSMPIYTANANFCATDDDKKSAVDKFSMDALVGSPNKSDADFLNSIIERIEFQNKKNSIATIKSSTPISKAPGDTDTSSNDLFSESPMSRTDESPLASRNLEQFDPNWGGDSLLELSQKVESPFSKAYIKRKISIGSNNGSMPLQKRVCLSNSANRLVSGNISTNLSNRSKGAVQANTTDESKLLEESFADSFEFNTQMEDIAKQVANKKTDETFLQPESKDKNDSRKTPVKGHLKLTARPKSDTELVPKRTASPSLQNVVIDLDGFDDFDRTFKFPPMIQDSEKVGNQVDDMHISDSEDVISGSPESSQRSIKTNLSSYRRMNSKTLKSLSLMSSPSRNSPRSSPIQSSPPIKYPPIGTDILKLYKSPSSKKSLSFSGNSPKRTNEKVSLQKNISADFLLEKKNKDEVKRESVSPLPSADLILALDSAENSPHENCNLPEKTPFKHQKISKHEEPVTSISTISCPKSSSNVGVAEKKPTDCVHQDKKKVFSGGTKPISSTGTNAGSSAISGALLSITENLVPLKMPTVSQNHKTVASPVKNHETKSSSEAATQNPSCSTNKNSRILDIIAIGENGNSIVDGIFKFKEMVFTIKTKKISDKETQKSQIGGKIVRNVVKTEDELEPQFKVDDKAILGIYLYGGTSVYYFNMMTLGTSHYRILKNLFSQPSIKLYGYNMNYQLKLFYKCCGYIISCKLFDLAVADWLLNPEEDLKSIEEMAKEYLKPPQRSPMKNDSAILNEVQLIWALRKELCGRLQKANLLKHFEEIEMPIQTKMLFMELTGIGFKHEVANELWTLSTEVMGKLEMDAFSFANHKFPLHSNSELAKVKKELKITPEVEADHPLIITVHNWRKLHSLKTRNLSQLLFRKDSRCHSWSSTRTATGRIIAHDPDLQHTPRDFTVDEILFSLRSAFVAGPGNVLVSADYSQLELRILAHFSQDPVLVPLLRKGDDVFKNIAAEWSGIPVEKVNDELRHQVKQLTYGIIYGMGDKALGESLGKTPADASMLSARFKRSFPKLDEFVKKTIEECRQAGHIKTLAGRVRYLPGINSMNAQVKAHAERQAVNSKIQGSAADIAKKAMVEVENLLNRRFPGRSNLPSSLHTSHLVLQLHDEFIYEVEESVLDRFIPILRSAMETATFLSVPLPVVVKSGKSWGSLKPVPLS